MKPGTKVVCIDDEFSPELTKNLPNPPREGVVYTVRDIVPDPLGFSPPGITLEGLENPRGWTYCLHGFVLVEFSFRYDRFIVVSEKADQEWRDESFSLHKPLPSIQN